MEKFKTGCPYFDAVIKDGVQGAVSRSYSSYSLSVRTFRARGLLNWELKNQDLFCSTHWDHRMNRNHLEGFITYHDMRIWNVNKAYMEWEPSQLSYQEEDLENSISKDMAFLFCLPRLGIKDYSGVLAVTYRINASKSGRADRTHNSVDGIIHRRRESRWWVMIPGKQRASGANGNGRTTHVKLMQTREIHTINLLNSSSEGSIPANKIQRCVKSSRIHLVISPSIIMLPCTVHQNRGRIEKDALAASRNLGVH
ncbi:hypothetical protein NC651_012164 [Populus alba x Populus x berolinensis]|nr:hypothetical protein NC651_012164 [Populus alba x Populus x berolinensis]